MKKALVIYYSLTGSNKFLAEQTAEALNCEIERIRPRIKSFPYLVWSSRTKLSLGVKALQKKLKEYDTIILIGPIWFGRLVSPLRDFFKKYKKDIHLLYFLTLCGKGDDEKNDDFGYATAFKRVKQLMGSKCIKCEAFPIKLVVPEEDQKNEEVLMRTRLSHENFSGEIKLRFQKCIERIQAIN